ncbi:MAG: MerR family transcriptional regulator [Rhizobiaceae bacterium]|nr:MAG: MerR family transcriptional regulator [Rhizobiaceae bacterium]
MMYIGELARRVGATPKAVRYYERLGLLRSRRTQSGYREFDEQSVEIVRAIRRMQFLGIPINEVREILALLEEEAQPCEQVRRLLRDRRADVAQRIRELKAFDRVLADLESTAPGGSGGCAILARVDPKARGRQSPRAPAS